MKLLHLTGNDPFTIMVEDLTQNAYVYMSVASGQPDDVMATYPLSEYKDIEHFAGVIGKFMPYTWILGKEAQIEIQAPSLPELHRAADILQKRKTSVLK